MQEEGSLLIMRISGDGENLVKNLKKIQ